MIPKSTIHWQGPVKAISRHRFKKQIPRGRSREHSGSSCPEPWYHAAGHGRSGTQVGLPENENPAGVPVLKLYYQRTKIQPADSHGRSTQVVLPEKTKIQPAASPGRSSTKVVLPGVETAVPENENPAGRQPRPLQY